MRKSEKWIIISIYGLTLGLTVYFALYNTQITSDLKREYDIYLQEIQSGTWSYIPENLVNSCLVTTLFPALIQRVTHLDPVLLFKLFPCPFFALMPMFVYLISRKYLDRKYSILVAMLVVSQFYFLYYEGHGRQDVAWGVFAGLVWSLINRSLVYALFFSLLLVISHYGTAYFAIASLIFVVCYLAIRFRKNWKPLRFVLITLGVLGISVYVWNYQMSKFTGEIGNSVIRGSVESAATALDIGKTQVSVATTNTTEKVEATPNPMDFYSLGSREEVIQVAFGKTLPQMNIPQKIEFVLSWFIVIMVSIGLWFALRERLFNEIHTPLAMGAYLLILVTLTIPLLSWWYGIERVWFTAMPALAPCFSIASKRLFGKISYWIPVSLIVIYALCVSGIMHWFFGIDK